MINPKSLTITGTAAAVALSATELKAKWVQITTPSGNSAQIRIGDSTVTASVGYPIPVGWAGMFLPPIAEEFAFYDLSQVYVYAATGDFVHVLFGG
jgi:hypothetical protein